MSKVNEAQGIYIYSADIHVGQCYVGQCYETCLVLQPINIFQWISFQLYFMHPSEAASSMSSGHWTTVGGLQMERVV